MTNMLETIAGLFPPVLFLFLHALEMLIPAQRHRRSIRWRVQGLIAFGLGGVIVWGLPSLWHSAVAGRSLLHLEWLPTAPAVVLVLLVANAIGYWVHRARHSVGFLWRFHQLHHSAERLDISGAFLFHPLESAIVACMFTLVGLLIGVSKEASLIVGMIGFFTTCFTHANIRTPRWLGLFFQRPESHSVHHARGVHAFNYADIPVVDMIFGTYRNPAEHEESIGFYDGADRELPRMLLGIDVSQPREAFSMSDAERQVRSA